MKQPSARRGHLALVRGGRAPGGPDASEEWRAFGLRIGFQPARETPSATELEARVLGGIFEAEPAAPPVRGGSAALAAVPCREREARESTKRRAHADRAALALATLSLAVAAGTLAYVALDRERAPVLVAPDPDRDGQTRTPLLPAPRPAPLPKLLPDPGSEREESRVVARSAEVARKPTPRVARRPADEVPAEPVDGASRPGAAPREAVTMWTSTALPRSAVPETLARQEARAEPVFALAPSVALGTATVPSLALAEDRWLGLGLPGGPPDPSPAAAAPAGLAGHERIPQGFGVVAQVDLARAFGRF